MQIRKILSWSSYLSVAMLLLTILSLVYSWGEVAQANKKETLTQEIRQTIFELIILRDDYLLHHQALRARIQYQAKTNNLQELLQLAAASFTQPRERQLLAEMQKYVPGVVSLFAKIVETRQRDKTDAQDKNNSLEWEERLVGQLALKTYALKEGSNRLSEAAQKTETAANEQAILFLCIFIALLGVCTIGSSATINRILRQQLQKLSEGTKILGSGNLHYRFSLSGNDELTELARLINEMAGKLQESYTSMENLKREVGTRQQAVDEKIKLEAQLAQAQKMEAIGTLAGGIAHDFNNILGIILGYAEMALLKVQEVVPIKEDIQEIQQAGKRAKELVKQILAFSRHTEHERIPLNINLLIKEVLKMLRASLPTTIKIHASIKSESTTLANPTQVHQILMNLCTNAGHAMREEGGILEISLSDVDFDESVPDPDTLPGPYIKLSVSDTGQGMPPEVLRMIFDPFFTTIRNRGRDRPGSISSIWHCQKSPGDYHRC